MRIRVVLVNKKTDEVRRREPKNFYTVSIPRKLEDGATTVYDNFYELEFENGSKERHSKMEWELYEYRK